MYNYPISGGVVSKLQPKRSVKKVLVLTLLSQLLFTHAVFAQTTEWVSKDSAGNEADDSSASASISGDGRFVAFHSYATNLVPGDTNGVYDVFVHDRETGETTRVSVDSEGIEANGSSLWPSLSGDGRFVSFTSYASNLVPMDTNGADIFVHDRATVETTRVSVDSEGNQADKSSLVSSLSGDGRFVVFMSNATNLVPNDTNGAADIFVHDRETGKTTRVSVDSLGIEANGYSESPVISGDGRYLAFESIASNLVTDDWNSTADIFVHDLETALTTRISLDSMGYEADAASLAPSISGDGRYVGFSSEATNLALYDTNGVADIFVHDRETGETTRVSVDSEGFEANGMSALPSVSGDGSLVAFESYAKNLVPHDTNGDKDIFVHDLQSGETIRVSVGSNDQQANNESSQPVISTDGGYVAFKSIANNLVPGEMYFHQPGDEIFVHGPLINQPLGITIDIAPRRDPNRIIPDRGRPAVAILTDASFDATQVDPASVQFGPAAADPMNHRIIDVDDDGDLDQVFYFLTEETGIACGDTEATLTGVTYEGVVVSGTDSIITMGCQDVLAQ